MRILVVIPIFNRPTMVLEALDSVVLQTTLPAAVVSIFRRNYAVAIDGDADHLHRLYPDFEARWASAAEQLWAKR